MDSGDARRGCGPEEGRAEILSSGKKLKGSWVLVRTKGWGSSSKPTWLLIKHRDDFASVEDIAETQPRSVVSNRLLTEIAIDEGGDVEKASTGDPVADVEKLLKEPKLLDRKRKKTPAVWHSNRSVAENVKSEEHEEKISLKGKRGGPRRRRRLAARSRRAHPRPNPLLRNLRLRLPLPQNLRSPSPSRTPTRSSGPRRATRRRISSRSIKASFRA